MWIVAMVIIIAALAVMASMKYAQHDAHGDIKPLDQHMVDSAHNAEAMKRQRLIR